MELEDEIFELWKELYPNEAYSQGLSDFAGKLFVPTKENKARILGKIQELKTRTEDIVQIKFLTSLEATLKYREAPVDFYDIIWTLFGHLVKEGINAKHISSLLDYIDKILENSKRTNNLDQLPLVLKIILMNNCNGILSLLDNISRETDDIELKKKIEQLSTKIRDYTMFVSIEGIDRGDFSEVFPILKRYSTADMGRKDFYPQLIMDFYDFYETPQEIEEKALSWLENEMPILKETAKKLADIYGVDIDIEAIDTEIAKQRSLSKTDLLDFIKKFRLQAQRVVNDRLVRINPKYDTRIMPTPDYLVNLIPTAAMTMFDTLTDRPFNVFFITTDEKRAPPTSIPDIFQMLIHEEYGHCVNFSNSALNFAWKPTLIENLNSKLHYPISEGISFHRELESLQMLEELAEQPKETLSSHERELMKNIEKHGDIRTILFETRFVVFKWRIIRFLRAISDVRINMHKQSLVEFVEWASKKTGFKEKTIYDQLLIFQEQPGYAPCYSIGGMALKEIQEEAKKKGKDILEFNTVASSLGFPPRTVWEERLRNF